MDSSKFNLWRACFSFCQVDQELARKEKEWIQSKIETLKFTDEQKKILANDIVNPPEITDILSQITKPSDRAFLVDQMRVLTYLDGTVSQQEILKTKEIREKVLAKINLAELEAQIAADEKASYHEDEVYKVNNKDSLLEQLHSYIMKTINPGDYKFPDKK